MFIEENDFNKLYKKLIKYVLNSGSNVFVNSNDTIECVNYLIKLQDINSGHIDFTHSQGFERQDRYERYRKDEIKWYESGCLMAIHAPAKKWKKIADEEVKIQSNYGYMILHEKKPYSQEGITSYKNVLAILNEDINSRQAILHYNLPIHYSNNKKDVPCTICTQILIRNHKLNFLVFQRSADLNTGLPYNVPWHCFLMKRLSTDLNNMNYKISCCDLSMLLGSVHIYQRDIEFMKRFLKKRK